METRRRAPWSRGRQEHGGAEIAGCLFEGHTHAAVATPATAATPTDGSARAAHGESTSTRAECTHECTAACVECAAHHRRVRRVRRSRDLHRKRRGGVLGAAWTDVWTENGGHVTPREGRGGDAHPRRGGPSVSVGHHPTHAGGALGRSSVVGQYPVAFDATVICVSVVVRR